MTHHEARERLKEDLGLNIPPKKATIKPVATEAPSKPNPKPLPVTDLCAEDRVRIGIDCATNAAQYGEGDTQHRAAAILLEFAEKLLYP